jgi:hypothetical protein
MRRFLVNQGVTMLEKLTQIAGRAATSASRRQFLGSVGRGAMASAAALGGLLLFPGDAQAARRKCGKTVCPIGWNYCCHFLDHGAGKVVHYCSPARCG